jgi:hypothetical protein
MNPLHTAMRARVWCGVRWRETPLPAGLPSQIHDFGIARCSGPNRQRAIAWSDLNYLNGSAEETRYRGVSFSSRVKLAE